MSGPLNAGMVDRHTTDSLRTRALPARRGHPAAPDARARAWAPQGLRPRRPSPTAVVQGIVWTFAVTAMTTMSATEARKQLYKLLDDVSQSHEPVQITGKRGNAVLVSEDDWRAVQETLYLVSIPGVRESILEGMATPVDELEDEPGW